MLDPGAEAVKAHGAPRKNGEPPGKAAAGKIARPTLAIDDATGFAEALLAFELALNLRPRKNEAKGPGLGRKIHRRVVVAAFGFLGLGELDQQTGFVFGLFDGGFAVGLEGLELGQVFFDGAADALLVGGEELEVLGLLDPRAA